jgi:hypothetical protein
MQLKRNSLSLFPTGFTLPSLTDEDIAQKITKLLPGITKASCVSAIRDAMASSKFAWQYISFVLHQKPISMQVISKKEALSTYKIADITTAFYSQQLHTILLIDDVTNIQTILHEFWHAFIHMVYNQEVAPKNITGCVFEQDWAAYPFRPATFANLPYHYKKVSTVYSDLDLLMKSAKVEDLKVLLRLAKSNRPILEHLMPMCASKPSKVDVCLLVNSIYSAIASCGGYALSCTIPSPNSSPLHLDIINPSLLDQLPKESSFIFRQLAGLSGTTALQQNEFISSLLKRLPISQEKMDFIALVINETSDCTKLTVQECDAILIQSTPLLYEIPSFQELLTLHQKEIQGHLTSCRPDVAWLPEEQASTSLSMASSFVTSAIFTLSMRAVNRCAQKATAEKIQYGCTNLLSLVSYCLIFQTLVGDTLGSGLLLGLLGALACYMNERLLHSNSVNPIVPQPVASCLSQGVSIAGLVYTTDQSFMTFSLSMASGIAGKIVTDKICDKCFAEQATPQPQRPKSTKSI